MSRHWAEDKVLAAHSKEALPYAVLITPCAFEPDDIEEFILVALHDFRKAFERVDPHLDELVGDVLAVHWVMSWLAEVDTLQILLLALIINPVFGLIFSK